MGCYPLQKRSVRRVCNATKWQAQQVGPARVTVTIGNASVGWSGREVLDMIAREAELWVSWDGGCEGMWLIVQRIKSGWVF